MAFYPLLGGQPGLRVEDRSVRSDEVGRRGRHHLEVAASAAVAVHKERVGQTMAGDEIPDYLVALPHAYGEDREALVPVVLVGRPQLGGIGGADRSIAVHERDGDRPAQIVAQGYRLTVDGGELEDRGDGPGGRLGSAAHEEEPSE